MKITIFRFFITIVISCVVNLAFTPEVSYCADFDFEAGMTTESEYFFTGKGDFVGLFEPNITQTVKVVVAGYDLFNSMNKKKRRFGCFYLEWSDNCSNRQEVHGKTLDLGTSIDYSRITIGADASYQLYRVKQINTSLNFIVAVEMTYLKAEGSVYDTEYGVGHLPANPEDRVGPFTTVEQIKANCTYRKINVSDYGEGLRVGLLSQTRIGKYFLFDIAGYYSGSGPSEDEEFYTIIREEIYIGLFVTYEL